MITLPGQLAIRTINGRHGNFNVGRLTTSIGEFVIKDALLEQYTEGKYAGDFAIIEIRPSYYVTGGRLVVEIRARLDSMTLDDVENLSLDDNSHIDAQTPDPVDDDQPNDHARPSRAAKTRPAPDRIDDDAPFGMPAPSASAKASDDAMLFGAIWPLGDVVKLDSTVDRQQLRAQCQRLSEIGYALDFRQQLWNRT
ncbi:DUF3275 family protein [Pseudomonas phytophila]|uniref:DUF3275 family protein n=1 Tax=Pseudomonas phytophila TaxID=2867264 RepID=A0ABY6FH47_9PSED|nr:DUF3275 family protein [Pseudomonas phytophila]UXZ97237.1 DUF3275 family protein [Pseudomonas phytophila]